MQQAAVRASKGRGGGIPFYEYGSGVGAEEIGLVRAEAGIDFRFDGGDAACEGGFEGGGGEGGGAVGDEEDV